MTGAVAETVLAGRFLPYTAAVQPRSLLSGALDLLYPERCVNCGAFGRALCAACEAALSPDPGPRCPMCWSRWDSTALNGKTATLNCPRCLHLEAIDLVRAAADMTGPARRVVHALKYRGVRSLAPTMAAALTLAVAELPFDAVYAVPLHRSRLRDRGFNQSELIRSAAGWPPPPGGLRRLRDTARQVGLHLGERRSNVSGAFAYEGPDLSAQTVALLDDVVTTGATANECARALREHGARRVVVIAFARASFNADAPGEPIDD